MTADHRTNGDVTIIPLDGTINFMNCQAVRETVRERLKEGRRKLALDFTSVDFMDSAGIATLIEIIQMAKAGELQVQFFSVPQPVLSLIEISGLRDVFPISSDEPDAVQQLSE